MSQGTDNVNLAQIWHWNPEQGRAVGQTIACVDKQIKHTRCTHTEILYTYVQYSSINMVEKKWLTDLATG